MKLVLSVYAKDLKKCDPFAVLAHIHNDPNEKPTTLGKTEVVKSASDPDWTKIFLIEDYTLGEPFHLLVSIRDAANDNENLGACMLEVGSILGAKGSIVGKELKTGGAVVVQVEPYSGSGTLNFSVEGNGLKNTEGLGLLNKSDPFFEIQRKAKAVSGATLWDCVYRSRPVKNDLNPRFDDGCVELSTLCKGDLDEKFRIAMYDFDKNGKHDDMGSFKTSVNGILKAVEKRKSFKLKVAGDEVGEFVFIRASTDGIEDQEEEISVDKAAPEEEVDVEAIEEDIVIVPPDEDIEIEPELVTEPATFVDYVKGGCQLRTIVAVDYTASNGKKMIFV